jgi:hypothetical protein
MPWVNRGKLWDIGEKIRGRVVLQRRINTKINQNNLKLNDKKIKER